MREEHQNFHLHTLVPKLKEIIEATELDWIQAGILFGSHARNQALTGSDIDVAKDGKAFWSNPSRLFSTGPRRFSMQVDDRLAAAYFEKFLVRVEVLPEYHKRQSYTDVIRESQEALDLFLKALLRTMGVTPSFLHDPGRELADVKSSIPKAFEKMSSELTRMSKVLRKERELSHYGAKDFIPTQEYTEQEAREVLEFLQEVAKVLKSELKKEN